MDTAIKSPPVGKREERRLERRRMILAVAAKSFLEHGYGGTTMSSISAQLGGSKATLWNHFSSKEELFAAFLDETTTTFNDEVVALLDPSHALRPALESFVLRLMQKLSLPESVKLYRLIIGEGGRFPEVGRMFYQRAPGAAEAIITRFLDDHMRAGHLRAADPILAARTLIALCAGSGHQQMLLGGPDMDRPSLPGDSVRIVDQFLEVYAPGDIHRQGRPARPQKPKSI